MASQSAAFPRTALITYGSETGTAQDAAEEISILTRRLRFTTRVSELDSVALVGSMACYAQSNEYQKLSSLE